MTVTDSCTILGVLDRRSSGVIVTWDPRANTFTEGHTFYKSENGIHPVGHLIQADNKKIYGMTDGGGLYNRGVLFEWDPATDIYKKMLDFEDSVKGSYPEGSLLQANNGKLYGMTSYGGSYGYGVIFEWDPVTEAFHKAVDFNGDEMGGGPGGALIQAKNGKLYGTTPLGGIKDQWGDPNGTLFELDPETGLFEKKVDFDGAEKGKNLAPALTEAPNGKLYGIAYAGGRNNRGVLFEWDPDGDQFTKKMDFSQDTACPTGSLLLAENGRLYGIAREGGIYGEGEIFEWDPLTDIYSKKLDVHHYPHQGKAYGSMIQGINGKFYGVVVQIPENQSHAVLYEYDPVTNDYVEKTDTVDGMGWYYDSDGLASRSYFKSGTLDTVAVGSLLSPSGRFTWTSTGTYADTIPAAGGCDSVITVNLTIVIPTGNVPGTFEKDISIFPNPTAGNFTVDMGKTCRQAEIIISQMDGRIVSREQVTNFRAKEIHLKGLPGLYIVTIITGDERAVCKVSKK
jgi:uncharacterized repeat protein (TIGR03803 family)